MHEGEFTGKLLKQLRDLRCCKVFKIHGDAMQEPGIPDFFIAMAGMVAWVEVKSAEGKLSPMQARCIADLRANGCLAFVLRFYHRARGVYDIVLETDELGTYSKSDLSIKCVGEAFISLLKAFNGSRKTTGREDPLSSGDSC